MFGSGVGWLEEDVDWADWYVDRKESNDMCLGWGLVV